MIRFETVLQQFSEQGEKTGWTYIEVSAEIAGKLKPGNKKSFKIKGRLDDHCFEGVSLIPMGDGHFIMAVNAAMRKAIRKIKGSRVKVQLEVDKNEKPLSAELIDCIADEPRAQETFDKLPPSHQRYFSNWIESARTDATRIRRITQAVIALSQGFGFSEMVRMNKKQ